MELPIELEAIDGAGELYEWFGYWPSFRDAEVVALHLNRRTPSSLLIHTWEMAKELDEGGYCVLRKHVVVEFVFQEIVGLNLSGFNHQNAIFGLGIEKVNESFRLTLEDC